MRASRLKPSPARGVVDILVSFEAGVMLLGHDDWDCLEDLEAAGFVQVLSLTSGGVKMTDEGSRVASLIRAHKASGGHFAGFRLPSAARSSPRP